MKSNQIKELHTVSKEELLKLLAEIDIDLKKITLDAKTKRLKNVSLLTNKRKDKARILTILKEKELLEA